jgi:hypothetical protein
MRFSILPSPPRDTGPLNLLAGRKGGNPFFSTKSHLIWMLALAIFACGIQPTSATAQTPSVSIWNTTRGGSEIFYVGDSWQISITGAAANQDVWCSAHGDIPPWYQGMTDGSGSRTFYGSMGSSEVGEWDEVWSVGPENDLVDATPTLYFEVLELPENECELADIDLSEETLYVVDKISPWSWYITGYSGTTTGSASSSVSPAGDRCTISSTDSYSAYGTMNVTGSPSGSSVSLTVHGDNCLSGEYDRPCHDTNPSYYYPFWDNIWLYVESWDNIYRVHDNRTTDMGMWVTYNMDN